MTTVNLLPAHLPKHGSGFDVPVATSLLAGAGVLPPAALDGVVLLGELGLDEHKLTGHADERDGMHLRIPHHSAWHKAPGRPVAWFMRTASGRLRSAATTARSRCGQRGWLWTGSRSA